MAKSLPSSAPSKKRLRPKIYSVAIYIVGLFIVLQILAVGSVFWLRHAVVQLEIAAPVEEKRIVAQVAEPPPESSEIKAADTEPHGRLDVKQWTQRERKIDQLQEEALQKQTRGDLVGARQALEKALKLATEAPLTLARLAVLEETADHTQKALEYWEHLIQLDTKAGNFLEIARKRAPILQAQLQHLQLVAEQKKKILAWPQKIFVESTTHAPNPIPQDPKTLVFDFSIHSSLPATVSNKMRVQLFFYDILPNHELAPAKIEAHFVHTPPDWSAHPSETLRAEYTKPSQTTDGRHYYGYLLRIIYDSKIQYEQAEPIELLHYFPYKDGN